MEKKKMGGAVCMLSRSKLHPHPDNPRKDLGDLEELRESIKAHGIMQNLTVVPVDENFEEFTILIGHRRYAASEGVVSELPCVIVEGLSDREQVGIMLCENMQRDDLTYVEQAHGFQMMMDLGDNVESISKKTGFSETTVRHRLEIAKLPMKVISEREEDNVWQIGINDYIELEKIKDLKDRVEVLEDSVDSDDLKYNINSYLREKKANENKAKLTALFDELGLKEVKENISYNDKYDLLHIGEDKRNWIFMENDINFDKLRSFLEDAKSARKSEIVYQFSYSSIYVAYKVAKAEKKKTKAELNQERLNNNKKALKDARKQICEEFAKCIADIEPSRFRGIEREREGIKHMVEKLWDIAERAEVPLYAYGLNIDSCDTLCKEAIKPLLEDYQNLHICQKMMVRILITLSAKHTKNFCDWNNRPEKNTLEQFDDFYGILYFFGLRFSDDFQEVIEGTSSLYEPWEDEK